MGNLLFSGDNIYKDSCVGVIDAHHGSNIPEFIQSLKRILKRRFASFCCPATARFSAATTASCKRRSTG